jgi:hypothetical protein
LKPGAILKLFSASDGDNGGEGGILSAGTREIWFSPRLSPFCATADLMASAASSTLQTNLRIFFWSRFDATHARLILHGPERRGT